MPDSMSNHDYLNKGFDLLLDPLADYVCIRLKDVYGVSDWWRIGVYDRLYENQRMNLPREGTFMELVNSLDVTAALRLIDINWRDAFKLQLVKSARTWVNELIDLRNAVAHRSRQDMTSDQAARGLETMALLLESFDDREEAEKIRKLMRIVRYGSEDGSVAAGPAEAADVHLTKRQRTLAETLAAGGLPSWRDVVSPQTDVTRGVYRKAEFAADLAQVAAGTAQSEYQDPVEFYGRTFVTAGMRGLLSQALSRVSGGSGEPVIQLKTAFGGGKTHSMLALYHLMRSGDVLGDTQRTREQLEPVFEAAGVFRVPKVHVACVVGTALDPAKAKRPETMPGITVNTLWGEIVYQLALSAGKPELYDIVKAADHKHVSPGSEALCQVMDGCGSCLVLLDELVAYAKKLYGVDGLKGGSFDNFITFVQELTEAARASRSSIVVASIPESEREIGGDAGQLALEAIEHTFGRMESIWKPVTKDEGFEIVSRRLFLPAADPAARDRVCEAFGALYRDNAGDFPVEAKEADYERRLVACYPVHPEVYDRLYEDWTTLPDFQRTRGVLRFMASVIHQLWLVGDKSPMILPGSLPLYDATTRDEITRYLPDSWNAVVDAEVDGEGSEPLLLDQQEARYGQFQAGRRVARTVFLGSAPDVAAQNVRGLDRKQILLGCIQPGDNIPVFVDALVQLKGRSQYLYDDTLGSRYWFDTRPSLLKTVADRMGQVEDPEADDALRAQMQRQMRGEGALGCVQVWPLRSADVPDEEQVRLVVLGADHGVGATDFDGDARSCARDYLYNRGEAPRTNRNMLVFCACESRRKTDLRERAKRLIAWRGIEADSELLNLDHSQQREVVEGIKKAQADLQAAIREAWCHLLVPTSTVAGGGADLEFDDVRINAVDGVVPGCISRLRSDESLLDRWAPMLLSMELGQLLWSGQDSVGVGELWGMFCRYTYLPRLADRDVLLRCIEEGSGADSFWGVASGMEDGGYVNLTLGERRSVYATDVLVRPEVARRVIAEREEARDGDDVTVEPAPGDPHRGGEDVTPPTRGEEPAEVLPHGFYLDMELDYLNAVMELDNLLAEVVDPLRLAGKTTVRLHLSLSAQSADGFDGDTQRTVRENCSTLGCSGQFEE
ncbi:DUF499 domain-containing protein [Atopobiaceae bacterium 24-176]